MPLSSTAVPPFAAHSDCLFMRQRPVWRSFKGPIIDLSLFNVRDRMGKITRFKLEHQLLQLFASVVQFRSEFCAIIGLMNALAKLQDCFFQFLQLLLQLHFFYQ